MIIVVLLPLLVAAEWVEIAQNTYRKVPSKPTRYDHTTSKNVVYSNHSIIEHQWIKGHVHRINSASVKRIQSSEQKSTVKIEGNTFHRADFISAEKPERSSEIKQAKSENVIIADHHPSQINKHLRIENLSRNELGNVSKLLQAKTVTPKTRPDATEKEVNKRFENTIKVLQNDIEKVNVGNNEENIYESEPTPCPDDYKNTGNKQKHTLNHDDKTNIKTKSNAMETLIKFLNVVSQTIKHGTRRTFKSKIKYLEDLRDAVYASIEARINSAFPDDTNEHRRRRTVGVESRGHVEFPSSESALMTISFLTFAVFLIKLVLQVIHTYKAKTMMVTPAVVATVGRTVFKKSTHN